jgi:hypothetical protein
MKGNNSVARIMYVTVTKANLVNVTLNRRPAKSSIEFIVLPAVFKF